MEGWLALKVNIQIPAQDGITQLITNGIRIHWSLFLPELLIFLQIDLSSYSPF